LVIELLNRQVRNGIGQPRLFEIGFGSGTLLKAVSDHGYRASGVEISPAMRDAALQVLGERFADRLLLGDLLQLDKDLAPDKPTLVYWNDVFEHICPDEIEEFLAKIHRLLVPGGALLTITPHWLLRPSDVTGDFCPPRTEPRGLHFKEYRLAEVSRLLKRAGFRCVATPLLVTRARIYLAGGGLRRTKQLCEMLLDELPVRYAHLACRGLGMSLTIATK
jgi:SAM-dependent methyltransferase